MAKTSFVKAVEIKKYEEFIDITVLCIYIEIEKKARERENSHPDT